MWYLSFSDGLISLSVMFSRSLHAAAKGKISFFFTAEQYSPVQMAHSYLFYLLLFCVRPFQRGSEPQEGRRSQCYQGSHSQALTGSCQHRHWSSWVSPSTSRGPRASLPSWAKASIPAPTKSHMPCGPKWCSQAPLHPGPASFPDLPWTHSQSTPPLSIPEAPLFCGPPSPRGGTGVLYCRPQGTGQPTLPTPQPLPWPPGLPAPGLAPKTPCLLR